MAEAPRPIDAPTASAQAPANHAAETRDALSRNVSMQMVAKLGYLVTRFLIPPFVLAHIGLEAYGVWATAFVLVSYLGVSTFGISNVYIKYVAEYSAKRQHALANGVLSAGVLITTTLSLTLFAGVYLLLPELLTWLDVSPDLSREAGEVILIVIAMFLASIAFSVFGDTLIGRQRIAAQQGIWVIAYLVETLLIFVLVGMGRGLQGLAEAYLIRTLIEIGLALLIVLRTEPWFSLSPRNITRESLRVILHFGGTVQVLGFLAIALHSAERLLAAVLIDVKAAGLVDIAKKLPGMAGTIPSVFAAAFVPAASYLHGGLEHDPSGRAKLAQLYLKGGRYMNLSAAFVCGFLATLPQPILDVWLGQAYPGAVAIMVLSAISVQINKLTGPGTSILKGIGRPHDEFYYAVPNILLMLILVPLTKVFIGSWELLPIVGAVLVATTVSAIIFIVRANRLLQVSAGDYLLKVLLPGLLPYLVGLLVALPVALLQAGLDRLQLAALVIGGVFLYSALTAGLTVFLVFDRGERLWFHAMAAKYLNRLRPNQRTT
jgi:O-antigen/teichoic acid export membrane protein